MLKQMLAGMICLSVFSGVGQTAAAETVVTQNEKAVQQPAAVEKKADEKKILVNLAARSLALYKNGTKVRLYPIGAGKVSTPTPVGYYSVLEKEENPTWTDPEDTSVQITSGANNPLGYRWLQFFGNYGIHGTNHPESVGGYVSNGCLRLKEADVEDLYGLVSVGTPVEIMYNRIVIEKIPDNTVVYYIYPDGYNRQPLDVAAVAKWLAGYGVDKFESDAAIADKIAASDGQPTYIAKAYALKVNGTKLADKAVIKDDITYLPAVSIATTLKLSLNWQPEAKLLVSPYGKATGYIQKDVLYFNADDVEVLFHLAGGLNTADVYELNTTNKKVSDAPEKRAATAVSVTPATKDVQKKTTAEQEKAAVQEQSKLVKSTK